jgi:hypothetical protein
MKFQLNSVALVTAQIYWGWLMQKGMETEDAYNKAMDWYWSIIE